ncbi:MAG: glutamine synthetase, partial [Muribaculaceae bacterium]|nr:glutamine synthetase [Muribaculaceae bacterium]
LGADKQLSDEALRMIAGMMDMAPSITAFGNTNPTSYFRLVPHQEAPTNVCWGDRNRSVLVRVPLGWTADSDMSTLANPLEKPSGFDASQKQTVEIRSADGSADIYLLLAGLAVAARHGFEMPQALQTARNTYVNVNIHDEANADRVASLQQLPTNCAESAGCLEAHRHIYEALDVFPTAMINGLIRNLKAFNDSNLAAEAHRNPELMRTLVDKYFHCG